MLQRYRLGLGLFGLMLSLSVPSAWAVDATPSGLSFSAVQGATSPAGQTVTISKNTRRGSGWRGSDNASWLTVSPSSGILYSSSQISVQVNPTGLAAGTYSGVVSVSVSRGGTVSIPVTLTVAPSSPTPPVSSTTAATLSWAANAETDLAGYRLYVGTTSGLYGPAIPLGNVTSYTVSNLQPGHTYYFALSAVDTAGNESQKSGELSKSIY